MLLILMFSCQGHSSGRFHPMNEGKTPLCARHILYSATTGIIFLFMFVFAQAGLCSTGARVPVSGERLVKEQLSHKESSRQKPGMKTHVIQPGDNFCGILEKSGLSTKDALYVAKRADKVYRLRKLRPGTVLELYFSPDGTGLHEVDYIVSRRKKVVLYNGKVITLAKETNRSAPAGSVLTSTRPAAERTAAPQAAAVPGRQPRNTEKNKAQVFPSQPSGSSSSGMKMFSSYRFGLPGEKFDSPEATYELLSNGLVLSPSLPAWDAPETGLGLKEEGRSRTDKKLTVSKKKQKSRKRDSRLARKADDYFLRAPLSYRRISSGYSHRRINPITNEVQPHLGIDYSAPSGTPVYSIGPGRILSNEWSGGYGKTIRVLHTNGYISQYAHLSRFARGVKPGKRVRKGEVIGYVGMTGLATGPHLDFRVVYQGNYINPAKIESKTMSASSGKTKRSSRG
jgi:murein DD-endopeptidase MepM/ murein hydrolase activator NlpD